MANGYRRYKVDVDFYYGPWETYYVSARSVAEARRIAKARYAREYFKKGYMKTYVEKEN